jgi:hypothetical protein
VPLRLTVVVAPVLALLEIAIEPLADPATVGVKLTCRLSDWPGLRVVGKPAPDILNPAPEIVAEFTVIALVPEEVNVNVCDDVEFTTTLPNATLPALTVN